MKLLAHAIIRFFSSVAIGKTTSSTSTSVTETSTTSSTASQSRSHFAANAIAQARAAAQMGHTTDPVAPQVAVPMEPYSTEVLRDFQDLCFLRSY